MKIGFFSFRIAGNDGVSLEAIRWQKVLERMGHQVTFVAGELENKGLLFPEFHFIQPKNKQTLVPRLKIQINQSLKKKKFDCLVVANIFSLPLNIPLATALSEVIQENHLLTIARHHDFWWEREKFLNSKFKKNFSRYFSPQLKEIKHITISSLAQKELKQKTGLDSKVISDSFDFKNNLSLPDKYSSSWREDFGIKKGDLVFLQPTRIIPRKKIETSIKLVERLQNPKIILIIAGKTGDEGNEYYTQLCRIIEKRKIRAKFIGERIDSQRKIIKEKRIYTLWDCFANADLVTYPSAQEGFGNQFIEAIYFKKPIFINRYPVFKADIEPLGFKTISIDGKITNETLTEVKNWLKNPSLVSQIVERNFLLGQKYFSFECLQKKLSGLCFDKV